MLEALRRHAVEYACEAACLGLFMISACAFSVALFHAESPVVAAVPDVLPRRALMGLAMGGTLISLVYSPIGRRSGAHMNPALTLAFWRLKKVASADALFYAAAQFLGGLLGVLAARALLGAKVMHESVRFAVTVPGGAGEWAAFAGELAITFVLMLTVLVVSNHPRLMRRTGLFAGALVALYIAFEVPLSGMSMNPARTLASAVHAGTYTSLWIYFVAPPLAMLLAAEAYVRRKGLAAVLCAKFDHPMDVPCPFRCSHAMAAAPDAAAAAEPAPNAVS